MIKMIYGTHSMIVIYFCHHRDFEIRPKTGLSPTNPRQRIKKVGTMHSVCHGGILNQND